MRKLIFVLVLGCQAGLAQLPEMYQSVDRLVWVVKDLDRVTAAWQKFGYSPVVPFGERGVSRGRVKVAAGRVGDVQVDWVQPLGGEGLFADFLQRHGEGVLSLMHRAPTREAFEAEVARLGRLGVQPLQRGSLEAGGAAILYAFFDTAPQGKYALGLLYLPPEIESEVNVAASAAAPKVTQFAFIARDLRAASGYWQKLGFPAMSYTHGALTDLQYRGQPGHFDQELGWQRHGKVVYEWIQPLKGPTVYEDYLKEHGEGVHHLAFNVADMDEAIAQWKIRGYAVSQSGWWGEKGKPGSGRFAYIDTEGIGGLTIELLWNYR